VICSRRSEGAIQVRFGERDWCIWHGGSRAGETAATPQTTTGCGVAGRAWRDMTSIIRPPQVSVAMSNPLSITVPDNVEARGVRFDDECVLIPGPQHRSRMTKLLAKPSAFIFKRKPSPQDPHSPYLLVTMTLRSPQPPPDPRKRRFHPPCSSPPSHLLTFRLFVLFIPQDFPGNTVSTRANLLLYISNAVHPFRHLLVRITHGHHHPLCPARPS